MDCEARSHDVVHRSAKVDGRTPHQLRSGKPFRKTVLPCVVNAVLSLGKRQSKLIDRWLPSLLLGPSRQSDELHVGTATAVMGAQSVRRLVDDQRGNTAGQSDVKPWPFVFGRRSWASSAASACKSGGRPSRARQSVAASGSERLRDARSRCTSDAQSSWPSTGSARVAQVVLLLRWAQFLITIQRSVVKKAMSEDLGGQNEECWLYTGTDEAEASSSSSSISTKREMSSFTLVHGSEDAQQRELSDWSLRLELSAVGIFEVF